LHTTLILSIIFRTLLLVGCAMGVAHAFHHDGRGFMSGSGLLYYTIQSNLWVFLMTAVYLALSAATLIAGQVAIPRFVEVARFAVMVAITITFLVFWIVLAPTMEKAYLLSRNNILVHTLVPLLFIADFFLFQTPAVLSMAEVLWSVVLPVCYLVFTLVNAAVNPKLKFDDGSRYPYFFLDADAHGWFGFQKGLGVCWWILVMLGLTLGLGYLFRFLQTLG